MSIGCLSLNASFEPLNVLPWRRAVVLAMRGVVEVLEIDETRTIQFGSGEMPFPTVIRLKKMVKVPNRHRSRVTNTFLFARDNYTCQYCGKTERTMGIRDCLTRDHVIPKSRGGLDIWTNVVTACGKCNSKKDNKTSTEAGLTLKRTPQVPHMVHLKWQIRKLTKMQEQYVRQFYGDNWSLYVEHEK